MNLIVILDDKNGMRFNNRPQSRDRVLTADMEKLTSGDEDFVFIEDEAIMDVDAEDFDKVIIYRWNRVYPSDVKFELSLDGFFLAETLDFKGSSHERITREVWARNER